MLLHATQTTGSSPLPRGNESSAGTSPDPRHLRSQEKRTPEYKLYTQGMMPTGAPSYLTCKILAWQSGLDLKVKQHRVNMWRHG